MLSRSTGRLEFRDREFSLLPHERSIKEKFKAALDAASSARALFDAGVPLEDLTAAHARLKVAYRSLKAVLPAGVQGGGAERHLGFMDTYLRRGQPQHCRQDAVDIEQSDLPALERAFEEWCAGLGQYDEGLRVRVLPPLENQQYDSAVRRAFVHLKARLVAKFGLPRRLDGARLYNTVLGSTGPMAHVMDGTERENLRALLCALHALFRNQHAHDDVNTQWCEMETVLVVINFALKRIEVSMQSDDARRSSSASRAEER